MPEVEWKDSACTDLLEIIDYISDDNPEAAQRLKDDIEAKTAKLSYSPRFAGKDELPAREKWWSTKTMLWFTPKTSERYPFRAYCMLHAHGHLLDLN